MGRATSSCPTAAEGVLSLTNAGLIVMDTLAGRADGPEDEVRGARGSGLTGTLAADGLRPLGTTLAAKASLGADVERRRWWRVEGVAPGCATADVPMLLVCTLSFCGCGANTTGKMAGANTMRAAEFSPACLPGGESAAGTLGQDFCVRSDIMQC